MTLLTVKKDFYQIQQLGVTGNVVIYHPTYQELIESGYRGVVSIRDLSRGGRSGKSRAMYNVPLVEPPSPPGPRWSPLYSPAPSSRSL